MPAKKYWLVRFKGNLADSRPVIFPPPGPWWETGFNDKHATCLAYLSEKSELLTYWPEAIDPEWSEEKQEIVFTQRFSQPDWWKEE